MQIPVDQNATIRGQWAVRTITPAWWHAGAVLSVVAGSSLFFAYLLRRFPYDGLYGQDSYAYYYEALILWQKLTGQQVPAGQLFSSAGLYHWPVGYHLHIMLGFPFAQSPDGGRTITLLMAILAPALVYLLAGQVLAGGSTRQRVVGGLVAAAALPLNATYTRMGLSLMADVPALFWGLLGSCCFLRAWPPPTPAASSEAISGKGAGWALAAGAALGLAVLVRYGSVLLVAPLLLYLVLRRQELRRAHAVTKGDGQRLLWALGGFILALLPQLGYALANPGFATGYTGWLDGWTPLNFFRTTVVSPDGTSTFAQPMAVFYLLDPLSDVHAGFLSAFWLPALLLGLGFLLYRRRWTVLGLLLGWWLLPALFYSATPYQAQRFTLTYLPALALLMAAGAGLAVDWIFRSRIRPARLGYGLAGLAILVCLAVGAYQGQASVRDWVATHSAWKTQEQQVISLARRAATSPSTQAPYSPRVVSFGITAALYYYTGWQTAELYNSDDASLAAFYSGAAQTPRLLVIPEESIATQWAGTALQARLNWIRAHYDLVKQGTANQYTVYLVNDRQTQGSSTVNEH